MIAHRINEILKHYQLTAQVFADTIGIQRSTLSHIFLGRNKPSIELLSKLSDSFPDISLDYIITGNGQLIKDVSGVQVHNSSETKWPESQSQISNDSVTNVTTSIRDEQGSGNENRDTTEELIKEKSVVSVLILYNDSTFKEFKS